MPEVARCNTIEVGEPVLRADSKIEACDQGEQTLKGAIRDRDRQRFLVKSFDIAADEVSQQPAQGPLLGFVPAQSCESLLEDLEGPQAVVLLRKPRMPLKPDAAARQLGFVAPMVFSRVPVHTRSNLDHS
jgi:hypothetical protein